MLAAQECCLISTHLWIFESFWFFYFYFFTILVRKDTEYDLSPNKFLSMFLLCEIWSCSILETVLRVAEKNVYPGAAGSNVVAMTVRSTEANRRLKSNISMLIFCLDDLSVVENREWSPWLLLRCCLFLASELYYCLTHLCVLTMSPLIYRCYISWLIVPLNYVLTFFVSCNNFD